MDWRLVSMTVFERSRGALMRLLSLVALVITLTACSMFDKDAIASMEKAITQSDLGLTPSSDGNVIRLSFPTLTERRKELIRIAHERAEEARMAVRNVRGG